METRTLYEPRRFNFLPNSEPGLLSVHLVIYTNFMTEEDVCAETFLVKKNGGIYRDRHKKIGDRWYRLMNGVESGLVEKLLKQAEEEVLVAEELEACFVDWV